ncbi:MAG TPA: class I SAM-dependent methyltransferase [Pyrinomonadaceae bacterium]|nr:class I SAM-dependent methyltransferase [Pyrinomonadaceae bacterium]
MSANGTTANETGANGDRIYYNRFYGRGGWEYSKEHQREFLVERLIKPLNLTPGSKVLEIGCGMGLHSGLLHELGFDVTGVDVSEVGIQHARTNFPGPTFFAMDLANEEFGEEEFDVIYSRGMSWYHYELDGVNEDGVDVPRATEGLFRKLKKGGVFVLQISTDFSGGRDPQSGVHYNRLGAYVSLFERFGEVVLVSNWRGDRLENQEQAERLKGHIIIATRK